MPDAELTGELIGTRLDAMAELPRRVFLLQHVDGLEVAAIGSRWASRPTVEGHLRHALEVLVWGGSRQS